MDVAGVVQIKGSGTPLPLSGLAPEHLQTRRALSIFLSKEKCIHSNSEDNIQPRDEGAKGRELHSRTPGYTLGSSLNFIPMEMRELSK